MASAPWKPEHQLVRIGLRGYEPPRESGPPCNLVFLVDVSGSMGASNKLPLVQRSLKYLVNRLTAEDTVALCVYAGAAAQMLPPTSCESKQEIFRAIDRLTADGPTRGGAGIRLAYEQALDAFQEDAVNRVVLATDGDFNVGITDRGELIRYIQKQAKHGVFLTTLGFGGGNLKDSRLEQLADKGNGNYYYVDNFQEAQRVFGDRLAATLVTIAKDVKIQVEFNPAQVEGYRLIGYENRLLAREDFNDDTKDAGEIGAGHTVTALYEVVPADEPMPRPETDPLRYQRERKPRETTGRGNEMLFVRLRYKTPSAETSRLLEYPIGRTDTPFADADADFRFASAVAAFGMLLRQSPHAGDANFESVAQWAKYSLQDKRSDERAAFLELVATAAETRTRRL